jgi:cobalt-zinc-cadmium resistance protein CzcA
VISRLIQILFRYRLAVLVGFALIVAAGLYCGSRESIDAYPDISDLMVQVVTTYPGRAAEDVERQITVPLEVTMRNVPKVEVIRSRTIFGLSLVQMNFEEGTELYWARQRILEKLTSIDLPPGASAQMGPPNTSFDEIYRYELVDDGTHSLMLLRELNDWVIVPRLLRVPGVSDVSNFGGQSRQFAVTFRPADLGRYGLGVGDVVDAVRSNNAAAGGSVLKRGAESFVIRSSGTLENIRQIENIFVKSLSGTPIYLRDVASVELDSRPPDGIFAKDKMDDVVEGIVLQRRGENASQVVAEVDKAIKEINESGQLPKGLTLKCYYNRQDLVDNTVHTVLHSVVLGIALVMLILLLFLGRPSMAILVAVTIPFSLLFALVLMYLTNIPIGLLSIGAIDFGIIVDGAIIVAENIARRLGEATEREAKPHVLQVVLGAILEMERSVFFSVLMIIVAYLPLLSLTRIEGLLFRPMAITMVYALLGSLVFALFILPVLATFLFRNGYREWENPLLYLVKPLYQRMIQGLMVFRWFVLAGVICVFAFVCVRVAGNLGIEFLPYMDEGVIYVRVSFPEGTSLQQNHELTKRFRQIVREMPEFEFIGAQSGRNDSGTDPFPPNRLEMMIGPRPRDQWTGKFKGQPKQVLIAELRKRFQDEFPTVRFNFTQPIIDNVLDDTNGTSANLAIELSGPDPSKLAELADQTVKMLKKMTGAIDVSIEQEGPQPQLVIHPDRALCARYNIKIDDVVKLINTALGGDPIGVVYEGERRFDIVAKFDKTSIYSAQAVGQLPVFSSDGVSVPLSQVAKIELVDGQTMIARENGKRRLTVRTDIVGRDQKGFADQAEERFKAEVLSKLPDQKLPPGYKYEFIGMFKNLQHAFAHLLIVLPITVLLLFGMLLFTFRSFKSALLLLLSLPFALIGGVVALKARGMNMNVSTCVGFAALFGVSIMNGVLMVRSITALRQRGMAKRPAILQGANDCLRPILLASLVAILGLLPASLATGLGSDVQRPLATVIVWGLFSSTVLTLFVVPVLYDLFSPWVPPVDETVQALLS